MTQRNYELRLLDKSGAQDSTDVATRPRIVWTYTSDPRELLRYTTIYSVSIFILSITYCNVELDLGDNRSISAMAGYSRVNTLVFTLLVYLHGYSLQSYLVILAEYLGSNSFQFKFVALNCAVYVTALVIVTYLPMNDNLDTHNVFSIIAFFFALLSTVVHKHGFIAYMQGDAAFKGASMRSDSFLISIEIVYLVTVVVMALLFWFARFSFTEYIFVTLILLDKEVKILIMIYLGLINIRGNAMVVAYISPPNADTAAALESQHTGAPNPGYLEHAPELTPLTKPSVKSSSSSDAKKTATEEHSDGRGSVKITIADENGNSVATGGGFHRYALFGPMRASTKNKHHRSKSASSSSSSDESSLSLLWKF